jgi:tetratricopeptide (TPR) repeat protein
MGTVYRKTIFAASALLALLTMAGCGKKADGPFLQGKQAYDKGDYDLAVSCYTEAIRLTPTSAEVYYNRGLAHVGKSDLDKAIADCTEAIRLRPDYMDAYYIRGWAYLGKRDKGKAEADFQQAKGLDRKS